eukprot:5335112-Amphidinium_carterae.1
MLCVRFSNVWASLLGFILGRSAAGNSVLLCMPGSVLWDIYTVQQFFKSARENRPNNCSTTFKFTVVLFTMQ